MRGQGLSPTRADQTSAALLLASCVVVPWLFVVALDDIFALPKVAALLLLGGAGTTLVALRRPVQPSGSRTLIAPVDIPVVAFVVWNVVACVRSIDPLQSFVGERYQHQGLLAILLYAIFFYLARRSFRDEGRVHLLFASIAIGATGVAAYALAQRAGLDPIWSYPLQGRVTSTIGQANSLAAYLVVAIPVSAVLFPQTRSAVRRGLISVSVGMMTAAVAVTLSRGGYLGLIVAASILALPLGRSLGVRLRGGLRGLVVALVAVAVLAGTASPFRAAVSAVWARALSSLDRGDRNVQIHLALWAVGARAARDHPVFGTGQETFAEVFQRYQDMVLTPAQASLFSGFRAESPHNVYLAIAAGAGFSALAAYLALVAGWFWVIIRALRLARGAEERIILSALLAAGAGHLVTDMFMTAEVTGSWLVWVLMGAGFGMASGRAARPDRWEEAQMPSRPW